MTILKQLEQLQKELQYIRDEIEMNEMADDYYYLHSSGKLERQAHQLENQINELQAQL